jgi:hypothetical protein
VIVDLRNIYKPDEMAAAGFSYVSIGRNAASPPSAETHRADVRKLA